ncbi:MAG: hypothetical protein HY690_08920 [Chloroflexi bacterium]|nr:hypothetical protein [Chloroflexota bacterium]
MDCRHVAEWLELRPEDASERAALEVHLQRCAACAARAQRGARLDDLLRASLVTPPPAQLSRRLIALARLEVAAGWSLEVGGWRTGRSSNLQPPTRTPPTRRPPRPEERAAAYVLAGLAAIMLGSLVGPGQWLLVLGLAWDVLTSAQVVLTSPVMWLLPDPADLVAWLAPALAVLLLAWALRSDSVLSPES